jgi:hypothetical protein
MLFNLREFVVFCKRALHFSPCTVYNRICLMYCVCVCEWVSECPTVNNSLTVLLLIFSIACSWKRWDGNTEQRKRGAKGLKKRIYGSGDQDTNFPLNFNGHFTQVVNNSWVLGLQSHSRVKVERFSRLRRQQNRPFEVHFVLRQKNSRASGRLGEFVTSVWQVTS